MAGSGRQSPVPVASLIPLVLATIAISFSAVLPIGWPTMLAVGVGLVLLWLFVTVERRSDNTILPKLTYRRGNALKWVYLTVAALSAGIMDESFIPLFGQQLADLSRLWRGFWGRRCHWPGSSRSCSWWRCLRMPGAGVRSGWGRCC